jgi:hypothetical protein
MRNDPFALLGVEANATAAELGKAFSQARARGIPVTEARRAFDSLRKTSTREAMSLLAISLTPGYSSLMSASEEDAAVEASAIIVGAVSAVLSDLEDHLQSDEVMPREHVSRDVRAYVAAPLEELQP